ncbi:MAG: hypothetical protein J6J17_04710 [Bacilli bacterium]|nr:hypothetical protein [Bacilli bacterium]
MKKYNVFKVLLIAILASIIISFLIPQSIIGYSSTGIEKGTISPITLVDSVSNGLTSLSVFISSFVYILCIGVFYAVIKKSGKYDDVINNTACKFKNKKGLFLVISILTLGILSAVIGDVMPMLVLVPAFIDIAKKLGFDSKKAIASTIGAIILGSAGSLYTNYTNQILQTTIESNIIAKIIILIISLGSLIAFALLGKKAENVKLEEKEIKKGTSISVAFDIVIFLIVLGMVPWANYFEFEGFKNFYTTITEFKVFDVSLFNAIIGTTFSAFGEWSTYTVSIVLIIASIILALIHKIKVDGMLESVAKGIRVALPFALIIVISNMVLVGVYNSGFFTTVITSIAKMSDSVLSSSTISALSSLVYPDYVYASQFTLSTITYTITDTAIYLVIAVIFQAIYSLFLLVSPTSILILMGLHYESVSYKDWIKYIYKYFLGLLIVIFMILMIIGSKYVTPISFVVFAILIVILVLFIVLCKNKKEEDKEEKIVEVRQSKKETVKKEETKSTSKKGKTTTSNSNTKKTSKKQPAKKNTTKKK